MANPITLESSPGLSEILGAYDTATGKPSPPYSSLPLACWLRGSVLSAVAADNGKLSLTAGTAEASAYGILLDKSVDTGVANSTGTVTGCGSPSRIVSWSGAHRRGWNGRGAARQATAPDRDLRGRPDRSGGSGCQDFRRGRTRRAAKEQGAGPLGKSQIVNYQGGIGLLAAPFPSSFREVEGAAGRRGVAMQLIDQRRDYDQIEGDHCLPDSIQANLRLHQGNT